MKLTKLTNFEQGFVGVSAAFDDGTRRLILLSPRQRILLETLVTVGARHVRGGEVRTARKLDQLGLAKLTDDGELKHGDRVDGERWSAEATALGQAVVDCLLPVEDS